MGSSRIVVFLSFVLAGLVVPNSTLAADCWDPPVDASVADPYREPACRWCPGNRGIEYATTPGQTVRAVASGRVSFAGAVARRRFVVVEHADGRRATYGLLADLRYREGDRVMRGATIGSAGERFHFGLREGDEYIDPAPYLGRRVFRTRLIPVDDSPARRVESRLVCGSVSAG